MRVLDILFMGINQVADQASRGITSLSYIDEFVFEPINHESIRTIHGQRYIWSSRSLIVDTARTSAPSVSSVVKPPCANS